MRQYNKYILYAIHRDAPSGVERYRISVKCVETGAAQTFEIPNDTEIKWNKLRSTMADKVNTPTQYCTASPLIHRFIDKQQDK